ncbi:MAG: hypothetical protein J7498_01815 [Sphingobium sp.]|nr:hypothetical protein [Sphingobium sp.]
MPAISGQYSALICADREDAARTAIAREQAVPSASLLLFGRGVDHCLITSTQDSTALPAGDHDPWTLMAHANRLVADADDMLALLAAASGREVSDPITGRQLDSCRLRRDLVAQIDAWDYADPFTGKTIDAIEWIEILGDWRAQIDANRALSHAIGIRGWKTKSLSRFLWADRPPRLSLTTHRSTTSDGKAIGIWPSRAPEGFARRADAAGQPLARIEDGFIRSIGLGAQLFPPCSIVIDMAGIYYDPSGPSDLERILSTADFQPQLIERADALTRLLVRGGVTKYAAQKAGAVDLPSGVRRILVPGQVADDLSVRLGASSAAGNLDLLRRARAAEPNAWIVYRPHPDVSTGLRKGHVGDREALRYADQIVRDGSIAALLDRVECVHTLTSLAGFEALLRGCQVVTHGQPFYAGWGLTEDLAPPIERRTRRLALLELVAGTLILYPRYVDPATGLPCSPEILVQRHLAGWKPRSTILSRLRGLQGKAVVAGRRLAGAAA